MKYSLLSLSVFVASLHADQEDKLLDNSFTITTDFTYMKREQGESRKLFTDTESLSSCKSRSLVRQFGFEPGYKVGASYLTHQSLWDVSYLWIKEWESHCSRSNPGRIVFSDDISIEQGADEGRGRLSSEFNNAELNYFRYSGPRHGNFFAAAYMFGIRYMNLKEVLDIELLSNQSKNPYKVRVANHIPAIQVGGLIAWNPMDTLTWDIIGKVGVGFDRGKQKTFFANLNNTTTVQDYSKRGFSYPLVVEGSIRLTYQPLSFINFHAVYQFIYLNGILLAPQQIVRSLSTHHVYRDGGAALIHGLTAGLAWSF